MAAKRPFAVQFCLSGRILTFLLPPLLPTSASSQDLGVPAALCTCWSDPDGQKDAWAEVRLGGCFCFPGKVALDKFGHDGNYGCYASQILGLHGSPWVSKKSKTNPPQKS